MKAARTLFATALIAGSLNAAIAAQPAAAAPQDTVAVVGADPDFDGDGLPDLVVGVPGEPGYLQVRYGRQTEQRIDYGSFGGPTEFSGLGAAVLARDLNGDGYCDLVVADSPELAQPGHLVLFFGGAGGLDLATATSVAPPDEATGFGWSLALLTVPQKLLVIGGEQRGVLGGSLAAYPLGGDGRPSADPFWISQSSPGVPGTAEAGDEFGAALAASGSHLVVGAPGEDIGRVKDAGNIVYLTYLGGQRFQGVGYGQNSKGVADKAETRDRFGESVAIGHGLVAVGVPGESRGAGLVQVFTTSGNKLKPKTAIDQNSSGVPGSNEAGDHFGAAVAIGQLCRSAVGVVVGAPGESLKTKGEWTTGAAWTVPLKRTRSCPSIRMTTMTLAKTSSEGGFLGQAVTTVHPRTGNTDVLVLAGSGDEDTTGMRVYAVRAPFGASDVVWSYQGNTPYPGVALSAR
jgi:hypothetical protein